jgi:DNA-directed RNA polymerase subunit beta'
MLSANNILSPASGRPIVTPSQDLIIGGYYLSEIMDDSKGTGASSATRGKCCVRSTRVRLNLHSLITLRRPSIGGRPAETFETTAGRLLFEEALPADYTLRFGHITELVKKKEMGVIVERLSDHYPKSAVAAALDAIKNVCYRYAAQSGLTVSIDDVKTPKAKKALLDEYEARADKVENQFRRGIITDGERRQQEVRIWTDATPRCRRRWSWSSRRSGSTRST